MAAQGSILRTASPDSLSEAASPAAEQALPKVDSFGLNVHHFEFEPVAFPLVAEARVGWVRLAAWWRILQPQPGKIDFGYLDRSVDAALTHGLRVLIVFGSIPGWANGTPAELGIMDPNAALPPANPQFFRDFVTAVVARFRGRVQAYEIWNEPNYKTFWNSKDYDRFVAEILINGARAVKAADPAAKTLGPAVDRSPAKFKSAAVQACRFLDALSCHLYVKNAGALLQQLDATYRPILVNQCNKPLWVTEFGIDSWVVGEDAQAKELVAALQGLVPQRPYLERLFLFHWRDGNWPYPGQMGLGLVGNVIEGYRRKKSFWAVQDLALKRLKLPGVASSPEPADGATNVPLTTPLVWLAGRGALSHRISLGPDSPTFQRAQPETTFPASAAAPREPGRTYFWRVDEVGKGGSTTGSLWQFTVEEDPATASAPVIVGVQLASPMFLDVLQGQGRAQCAPVRSLVLPGTPEDLAAGAWTVASPAIDLTFLLPAGKAPDPLTITLSGLRPGEPYRVFGRYVTPVEQAASPAAIRMGLDPAVMALYDASTRGASVVRQVGQWQEREVQIGSVRAESGGLKVVLDGQGVKELAGWSGLRLELGTA
jgi:hypothetical protein